MLSCLNFAICKFLAFRVCLVFAVLVVCAKAVLFCMLEGEVLHRTGDLQSWSRGVSYISVATSSCKFVYSSKYSTAESWESLHRMRSWNVYSIISIYSYSGIYSFMVLYGPAYHWLPIIAKEYYQHAIQQH